MKSVRLAVIGSLAALLVACTKVEEKHVSLRTCAAPDQGRACAMCFAAEDAVYVASGRTQDGSFASTMLRYDTSTDQWNTLPFPITPRVNGTACASHQGIFLGLGWAGGYIHNDSLYLQDWWLFQPSTNNWTRLADFPSDKTAAAVCWSDGQNVWVTAGFHAYSQDVWCYDIAANQWTKSETSCPARIMSPVAAQCDGRYFFGTGFHNQSRNEWYEWYTDNRWEKRTSVPGKGRHNAACAATDRSVWVFGGWHYGDSLTTGFHYDDILQYNPQTDQWFYCGAIPCGKTENGVAASIGNTVFFGLGEDPKGQLHQAWYAIEE